MIFPRQDVKMRCVHFMADFSYRKPGGSNPLSPYRLPMPGTRPNQRMSVPRVPFLPLPVSGGRCVRTGFRMRMCWDRINHPGSNRREKPHRVAAVPGTFQMVLYLLISTAFWKWPAANPYPFRPWRFRMCGIWIWKDSGIAVSMSCLRMAGWSHFAPIT